MSSAKKILETVGASGRWLRAAKELKELKKVEELIACTFKSDSPVLQEIPEYLLGLGGKRIRPILTLLCARALGLKESPAALIDIAAGLELIHMATLLHDDIIDNSSMRRHKPSPLAKYGMSNTLLSGDFLLVRAFGLCAKLHPEIIRATEDACIELVEGENLEIPLYMKRASEADYLVVAKKKTAALFRLGAFSAAHIAKAERKILDAMSCFGESLGIAFQILDDILDITAEESSLGKKIGSDILERKPSIVNILWLNSGSSNAKLLLTPPAQNEEDFVQNAVNELRSSEVISKARSLALKYANSARDCLKLAEHEHSATDKNSLSDLESIIDFTLERLG